jgi:hypothetical protein
MKQSKLIQVRFSEDTEVGRFSDTLFFTEDEFAQKTQADIDALAQARIDAHVDRIKNPPAPVEPTLEELQEQKANLEAQLTADIEALQTKIATKTAEAQVIAQK